MADVQRQPSRRSVSSIVILARNNVRQIRFNGSATLVLAGVVMLTAFAVVATPRFLNQVSDDALRKAVVDAAPINRNISIEQGMQIRPEPEDVFAGVVAEGEDRRAEFSAPIQDIIGGQRYVVDSQSFEAESLPGEPPSPFPRFLRMRYQEDIESHVTLVQGDFPSLAEPVQVQVEGAEGATPVPAYEIAITQATSDLMQIGIGDSIVLTPQREDPLNRGATLNELSYNLVARVSGIIEIDEPEAEYWFGDTRLQEPLVVENPDFVLIFGTGLMSPSAYGEMLGDTSPSLWSYTWRYFVDPERLDAGEIGGITDELQALEVQFGSSGLVAVDEPHLRTGLVRIANRYERERQLTIAMLSLVVAGVTVVALAVIALLGALIASGRRGPVLLTRSRGASSSQLGWAQGIEGIVVFTPAALIGMFLASVAVAGRPANLAVPLAIGVALLVAGIAVALSWSLIHGDLGRLFQQDEAARQGGRYRPVIEAAIVLVAIGGLVLFRRRGLEAGSLSDPDQGFDPFLAAVPVLLALTTAIVMLRLYPLPVRLGAWFGSLRRGAVVFIGFRRVGSQPLSARLPMVVMLVATGIAVFAAVMLYSITEGQQNSTWQEVGADYRVQSVREEAPISSRVDFSGVAGIEASADAAQLQARDLTSPTARGSVTLLAMDTADYQQVAAGTRADPEFPEAMLIEQNVQGIGTDANPVPAVVSEVWTTSDPPNIGDILTIEIRRTSFKVVVRDIKENFPSLRSGEQFIVVPRSSVEAVDPAIDTRGTFRYLRAPASVGPEIEETLLEQSRGSELLSRQEIFDELANAPLVDGVETGFQAAAVVATLYAVLAALAGIALTARDRARDLGYLRTLGLTSRQATALTVIEQLPPAILATIVGAGLGVLLVLLIEPGLELSTFAGSTLPADVLFDGRTIALVAGIELFTIVVAVAVYSYLTRRMNLGNVLRLGDR